MHPLLSHFVTEIQAPDIMPLSWELRLAMQAISGAPADPRALAALYCAGQRLCFEFESRSSRVSEPAYHNAHHAREVVYAATTLWAAVQEVRQAHGAPLYPAWAGYLLVVAMLGHDLGHPGAFVDPQDWDRLGVIEEASASATDRLLVEEGVDSVTRAQIRSIILSSEPVRGVPQAIAAWRASPEDLECLLPVLAIEADILGSLCWPTGPHCGQRLAREWRAAGARDAARAVGSWTGRRRWLTQAPCVSPAAHHLGLPQMRDLELALLESWAPAWDHWPWPQAQAAHVQAMESLSD